MKTPRSQRLVLALTLLMVLGSLAPGASRAQPATPASSNCLTASAGDNAPAGATALPTGASCVSGANPAGGQHLARWIVDDAGASERWTFRASGVPAQVAVLEIYRIVENDVGMITEATKLVSIHGGVGVETVAADLLWHPGTYMIGLAYSGPGPYTLTIEPGAPLPDQRATDGTPVDVAGAFAVAGLDEGNNGIVTWTLDGESAASHYTLAVQVPAGSNISWALVDASGANRFTHEVALDGTARIPDLGLEPGTYTLTISPYDTGPTLWAVTATSSGTRAASLEDEPNDAFETAMPLAFAGDAITISGGHHTLPQVTDRDTYRLTIDQEHAGRLLDIRLLWRGGTPQSLCLFDATGAQLRCTDGTQALAITDLVLAEGDYTIQVSGQSHPGDAYQLKVDVTAGIPAGFEAEPNDTLALASPLVPSGERWQSAGRLQGNDTDQFRMTVAGEPELWLIEAVGEGVTGIRLVTATGQEIDQASANAGTTALWDAFLLPGDHVVIVQGSGGDYTVSATPLGRPDPLAEHEPNNSVDRSQPTLLGERRTGRLVTATDVDAYRFSLQAETFLGLDIEVPEGAAVRATIEQGAGRVLDLTSNAGEDLTWRGSLPAGDYVVTLSPSVPSESPYAIMVTPLDPFTAPDDREPNDDETHAAPIPASLRVSGTLDTLSASLDVDWYVLPPFANAQQVTITFPPAVTVNASSAADGVTSSALLPTVAGTEAGSILVDVPAGIPVLLEVRGTGPYDLVVTPAGATPPAASPVPGSGSGLTMAIAAPASPPAAYWSDGQVLATQLTITNTGGASRTVDLTSMTGRFDWRIELDTPTVTVAPGASVAVPVRIHVAPDAWADVPIYVAFEARDGDGSASAMILVTPSRTAPPGAVEPWSPLPEPMLGGLNAAWTGLGATPVAADNAIAQNQAQMLDQLLIAGTGVRTDRFSLPAEFTVDLAGDDPVPVVGAILFPLGPDASLESMLGAFELQLSMDGVTYATVLEGHLSVDPVEQAFALDQPVEARFARLRVLSAQDVTSFVTLGEWKVVADPGWTGPIDQVNLADPALGGHIVDLQPPIRDILVGYQLLLTPDGARQTLDDADADSASWVVGFHHDRAAMVTGVSWLDPPASDPAARIEIVTIEVATESPGGPWTSLGDFPLARDGNGTATIDFDQPVWARFVRLTGSKPIVLGNATPVTFPPALELPEQVMIHEASVQDGYRSILGEWGTYRSDAMYESAVTPDPIVLGPDAGNSAADATTLTPGTSVTDSAAIMADEDWYALTVPAGDGTLAISLSGYPALGVTTTLYSASGDEIPVERTDPSATVVELTAQVEPGATYTLRVTQPPTSVVFAFDTSASIGALEPAVYQALTRFAGDVEPGREAVNVLPFGEQLLLETWSDEPYYLQATLANYPRTSMSSDAEGALVIANEALAQRDGTRAIFLITDGESGPTVDAMSRLWPGLTATAPRIYAVQIAGGSTSGGHPQDLMQDWALVNNGSYTYVRTQGDLDIAFDRAATELRRPAIYTLTATTSAAAPTPTPAPSPTPEPTPTPAPTATPEPSPTPAPDGSLMLVAPPVQPGEPSSLTAASNGNVAIILDTSGSMLQGLDGGTRADIAKTALIDLVTTTIPAGTTVSLRTFGDTPDSCDTILAVPPGPLDPDAMAETIANLPIVNLVRTPIGASLEAVRNDLGPGDGPKIVVLVTDGEETCDGDAAAAISALVASGIDVRVNIVGFAIDDPALEATFQEWATLGNGQYIDAGNAAELNAAIAQAVQPTYDVVEEDGAIVASGQVGAEPVALPPGTYRIVVHAATEIVIDNVVIRPGEPTEVTVPAAGGP